MEKLFNLIVRVLNKNIGRRQQLLYICLILNWFALSASDDVDMSVTPVSGSYFDNEIILFIGGFLILLLICVVLIVVLKTHVNQAVLETERSEMRFEKLYNENSAMLASLPMGIEIYGTDGKLLYSNDYNQQLYGIPQEDVVGKNSILDSEILPKEVCDAFEQREMVTSTFCYDSSKKCRYDSVRNEWNKNLVWLRCIGKPVFSKIGEFEKYFCIVSDVTEIYLKSKELEMAKLNLSLAINAGDINVWGFDIKDKFFYDIQGSYFGQDMPLEKFLLDIYSTDVDTFMQNMSLLQNGNNEKCNSKIRIYDHSTKEILSIQFESISVKDENGNVEKIVGTMRDVTSEVNHEMKLVETSALIEKSRQELEKKNIELESVRLNLELSLKVGNVGVWAFVPSKQIFLHLYGNTLTKNGDSFTKFFNMIHPNGRERFMELWGKLLNGELQEVANTTPFINPRGKNFSPIYIDNRILALTGADGKVERIIGTHCDVTERYVYHRELEATNRKNDLIIRISKFALWEYDVRTKTYLSSNDVINGYNDKVPFSEDYCLSFYNSEDFSPQFREAQEIMHGGVNKTFTFDMRVRTPENAEWQYCTVVGAPLEIDDGGNVLKYVGLRQNNTEIVKLSKSLTEKNIQLNMVLRAGKITPMVIDIETLRIFITAESNGLVKVHGSDLGLSLPRFISFVHPDDRFKLREMFSKITEGETSQAKDELRIDQKGEYNSYYEISLMGLNYNRSGKPSKIVGYVQDISETKRLMTDLEKAKNLAEQSNKLKSAFLANMSHEIRTPLNAIIGFSELITSTDELEEKEEYMNIIKTNNDLLLRLINDILDLSKIEAGMVELKYEQFDLSALFEDAYAGLKQKSSREEVQFLKDNPYKSCVVSLDKNRVLQIITNYATNAIKYTPKGSITMGYVYENNGIKLYVKDTGIGIADEKKNKLFQRFEKLDDFAQGTGLGLSIVKALVETAKGNVGCDSEFGKGSTFWAWVPCEAEIEAKEESKTQLLEPIEVSGKVDIVKAGSKVLVAELNDNNYLLLSQLLKKYQLKRVRDLKEILNECDAEKYEALIVDVKMSKADSLKKIMEIKEKDNAIRIIAMSSTRYGEDHVEALEAGCECVIRKPIKADELSTVFEI